MKSASNQNFQTKSYNVLVDFVKFLKQNGDKLFDKDFKLCLRNDQLLIIEQIIPSNQDTNGTSKFTNSKEFVELYKTNQLHLIQDFLCKIANLKIVAETRTQTSVLKLNIFGSLTYLEIKNIPINSIGDLNNLRNQLQVLICNRCTSKVKELLHLCGADQSMPLSWPKLHTLNLSDNELTELDNSLRLANSLEILDLSHNNLKGCGNFLNDLTKLKKVNLSFNKLESLPSFSFQNDVEYLDVGYNNIDKLDCERLKKLTKLRYLNLKSNFVNHLNEIYNLKFLRKIQTVVLEKNPVKNDSQCDYLINTIIANISLNKHKTNQDSNISSNEINKIGPIPKSSYQNDLTITSHIRTNKIEPANSRRKLKANNILIEHDDQDYVIISSSNNLIDSSKASVPNNIISTSYTEYESNNLQSEIEKMKQMRKNYGTDWLLSTPNLISYKPTSNEINNEIKIENLILIDKDLERFESVLDPFVVFKQENSEEDENSTKKCVLLLLNDKYLIEKDETNSIVLRYDEFIDIRKIEFDNYKKQIKFINKNNETNEYNFDNSDELKAFIDHLRNAFFNSVNFLKSDIYFCAWCKKFNQKSKFIIDEASEINLDNLTCTVCNNLCATEKTILNESNESFGETKKITELKKDPSIDFMNNNIKLEDDLTKSFDELTNTTIEKPLEVLTNFKNDNDNKIVQILSKNNITKTKLDEVINECRRINNNLKLFIMISKDKNDSMEDDNEETEMYLFKMKYLFYYSNDGKQECIENSLCVLSNKNILIFKIVDLQLFNDNVDFDKCLKKELTIQIEHIESIEIGLANNYISIELNQTSVHLLKLFTQDIHLTYTMRNILLKIINESKSLITLNNSRKISHFTRINLEMLLTNKNLLCCDSEFQIDLLSYIEEFKINGSELIRTNTFKYSANEILLYSNEFIIVLVENLNYLDQKILNESQFELIEIGKICDIVQLKLFKDEETKLEINFVDESMNSKNINWSLNFNYQPHMLSQLMLSLKNIWEQIYSIELPINYFDN